MSQNGFIIPNFQGENKKYLSCHHLVIFRGCKFTSVWLLQELCSFGRSFQDVPDLVSEAMGTLLVPPFVEGQLNSPQKNKAQTSNLVNTAGVKILGNPGIYIYNPAQKL